MKPIDLKIFDPASREPAAEPELVRLSFRFLLMHLVVSPAAFLFFLGILGDWSYRELVSFPNYLAALYFTAFFSLGWPSFLRKPST